MVRKKSSEKDITEEKESEKRVRKRGLVTRGRKLTGK